MALLLAYQLANLATHLYANIPLLAFRITRTIIDGLSFFASIVTPQDDHLTFPETWKTSVIFQTKDLDVLKCTLPESDWAAARTTSEVVTVKLLRFSTPESDKLRRQKLKKAITKWEHLQGHLPSDVFVVRLLKIAALSKAKPGNPLVVTEWYGLGNLLEYLSSNEPRTDPLHLLLDGARAASYLHRHNVVHGNICANNLLVGLDGHAYLTDIGIHEALRPETFTRAWRHRRFTHRYEEDNDILITKEDDVHAFGMTIFEAYTGMKPFPELSDCPQTIAQLVLRGFPEVRKPSNMPETVWDILQDCIGRNTERPTMQAVEQSLHGLCDPEASV